MECIKFADKIDDFVDSYLDQREAEEMEMHLAVCLDCRKLLQEEKDFRRTLKEIPVPEVDTLSLERMMRGAKREYMSRKKRLNTIYFGVAAAACLVLLLTTGLYQNRPENMNNHMVTAELAGEVNKTINLVFNCTNDMEQAELTIILPDNIELAAFPGQHQLTWETDLKAGGNLLPLEIITSQPSGMAIITARVEHKRKSRMQTLNVSI